MTTIIAKEWDGGVTFAFDSRVTTGAERAELADEKVFRNGNLVFAVCGPYAAAIALKYLEFPKVKDWDHDRYMTLKVIPMIRESLANNNCLDEDGDLKSGGRIIAVSGGRAYLIGADLSWHRRADGNYVIGSGGDFAMGALSAGATVRDAVAIAAKHDSYTGDTIHVRQLAEILEAA